MLKPNQGIALIDKKLLRRFFTGLLLAAPVLTHAVMPPYYEARAALERIESAHQQRTRAQHVVVLRLRQVHSAIPRALGCPTRDHWELEAEVVQVLRGELKPGALLKVEHTWEHYDCPGPVREATPELTVGQQTEAYLNCPTEGLCTLAAGAMSFVSTDAFAQEWVQRKATLSSFTKP